MARYRGRYYVEKSGYDYALEHIRQAEELTWELGGTDKDVKRYFFSLDSTKLGRIFDQYESKYGIQAREYAENTLPKWKSKRVHMSGMVAERLFNLLPPTMPIEIKHQLAENLWEHVGPKSSKIYYIGLDADIQEVAQRVKDHLEEVVINYVIPDSIERRFNWLSQGDIEVKQILLNHFRQQNKLLLAEAIRVKLPVILDHLNSKAGKLTTHAAEVLEVGKHVVRVEVSEYTNGITEIRPMPPKSFLERYGWVFGWGVFILILYFWLRS